MRWRRMAATAVCWPGGGEADALVRPVVDQLAVGEALHRGGDGAGGQPEHVGERAGVRLRAISGQAVDGLEGLSFGLREGVVHQLVLISFWSSKSWLCPGAFKARTSHQTGVARGQNERDGRASPRSVRSRETAPWHLTERQEQERAHVHHRGAGRRGLVHHRRRAPPPGHPLHHVRHRVLPEGERLLSQPGLPGPRVRRGRALADRAPCGATPTPSTSRRRRTSRRATTTSRSRSRRSSSPRSRWSILGQVASGLRRRRPDGRCGGRAGGRAAVRDRRRRAPDLPVEAGAEGTS